MESVLAHIPNKRWLGTSWLPHDRRTLRSHSTGGETTHTATSEVSTTHPEITHQCRIQLQLKEKTWNKSKVQNMPIQNEDEMLVFVTSEHNGVARLGAREKQSGCISSVCVMWKRQRVPNTIPFSKGKTSISHTHTRCFAYFSKLRHTHTLGFPSPRRCTHPRSCKLQDSKQIFPQPKMAVGRWPLLIQTWGESSCCSSSSLTPRIPPDVRNGGSSKELIRGGLWRPTSHSSQRLSHVRSHFESGFMSW